MLNVLGIGHTHLPSPTLPRLQEWPDFPYFALMKKQVNPRHDTAGVAFMIALRFGVAHGIKRQSLVGRQLTDLWASRFCPVHWRYRKGNAPMYCGLILLIACGYGVSDCCRIMGIDKFRLLRFLNAGFGSVSTALDQDGKRYPSRIVLTAQGWEFFDAVISVMNDWLLTIPPPPMPWPHSNASKTGRIGCKYEK